MEDGGGVGREKSHKRPHPSEDDDDDVEFISFKKQKRDPELSGAKETEDDVLIVEETQGATGTSANDAKPLGKEDFVVTYFKPSDTIKYPHAREDCRAHKFNSTIPSQPYGGNSKQENTTFCDSCYCYVCDIPAKECQQWIQGDHCNAHSKDTSWKLKRKKTVADNSRKKARQSFASHPSLRSSLSKEERETEGMSSFQDSSLDEILNRIDSTYKEYSAAPETNDCDIEDDCYCYCHEDSYWGRRRRRCWYDYEEESCYECEHNHYDGTSASYHDYEPVRRALNSAVTSARTHWQNKKPLEALVILEETMRSLCLHQPCEVTLNSYSGETSDGGLVSSKRAIMQSIEELLVDMFLDKSGILLSSLKEKALSAIKRTFDLAPQNSGNIGPNIALGLKSWDDQELLAVLNGSYNSGQDKAASSSRGNCTAEVIVVEDTTSQSNTTVNSNFTEDYLVVKKRLQILENEKRWQEAANYIQKVNIRGNQYGIESHLKDKLLTYQAHLGKWNEVRLELIKIMPNQAGRIRLVRMEPTDFLNIMKCFTTGQDIEMMPASSPSTATPSPGVNMDEVFRIYLYAMATGQNYSLKHNEKCVSWFIAWTCQETLQEIPLGEFQRLEKQAKSVIATSQTRVTNLEHMSNLNSKVGRAVTATCWLSSNLSSRSSSYLNVSTIMDGYKNNVWLAVFLLMKLCDDLKAYFSYGLSEACHKVANWITTHGGFVLQHGHPGSITLEKVLSLLPLVKAKELLENILAAVLTGDRTPEERVKIIQQAKRVVSKLTNNRQLMMGRILLYMAKDGQCKEVQEELMKEKQDAKFRPVKALAQIGDEDFLDIMKALVESVTKLRHWGADQSQATRYIENEIFLLCIYGLLWNDKVQQSMSFISWFLGLLCATTMEEPSDAMMKILEDIAKSIREAVDKRAAERKAASIVGKECKAVVACILALPGLKCREYSDQLKMKIILDALKENKWLLMFVLNRPDGPSGTVVTEWICEENGPKILNDLTEEATTRLVSFMDKGTGYDILKRLVTMSDKKGLGKKRRAVQFAMCLLNQLQKYDRKSNDILAFIISKVGPNKMMKHTIAICTLLIRFP
ncbi:uncharacterized protein [Branchiostoma lanceolatum]|uniref:uncharacterized protein n=1 Tax=Branchiostoma lanceolatum TaxID=7740 RepID=UPI00345205FB